MKSLGRSEALLRGGSWYVQLQRLTGRARRHYFITQRLVNYELLRARFYRFFIVKSNFVLLVRWAIPPFLTAEHESVEELVGFQGLSRRHPFGHSLCCYGIRNILTSQSLIRDFGDNVILFLRICEIIAWNELQER